MKVLFRVDASITIGSGHVMRCLTLAHALKKQGANCHFACRSTAGNLLELLQQAGFNTISLPANLQSEEEDASATLSLITDHYQLLIVDHYQLGKKYSQLLRQRCHTIMVIDDLANRPLDCDLLLDQNLLPAMQDRYHLLVPAHCQQLLGPQYALLREEFYQQHAQRKANHLLVSFGGSDQENLTSMAIEAISCLKSMPVTADIVIGINNPWRTSIEQRCSQLANMQLHVQTNVMSTLMQQAQLMLGAGGATHWERCISRLPSLVVTVAKNQHATTQYLDKLGACIYLGTTADVGVDFISKQLCKYLSKPELLSNMVQAAGSIVPLNAGTPLVVEQIMATIEE